MKLRIHQRVLAIGMIAALGLSGCSLERVVREVFDGAVSGASGAVEDAVAALVGDVLPPNANGG